MLHGRAAPTEQDALIHNLKEHQWFGSLAPLTNSEERTAHTAPGYPWLLALLERSPVDLGQIDQVVRWLQAALGALTAGFYFLFARRAFGNRLVSTLAGALCALHPYWIISTAELNDGVLAAFLLATAIYFGACGGQDGGPFTSFLYGLALAALALVRAPMLPFAFVAMLWFLLRCKALRSGWLFALLAFLGFTSGLAPWMVRNWQAYHDVLPIVDSTYLHLWMGSNSRATGGPQTESTVRATLNAARGEETLGLDARARNRALGQAVWHEMRTNPAGVVQHRLEAGVSFYLGEEFLTQRQLWRTDSAVESQGPDWWTRSYPIFLTGSLLGMLLLGVLGWRWTYAWRGEALPSSLALIWVPLPYFLGHAEALHGPRLPLDGVLICYATFALVCLVVPTVSGVLFQGGPMENVVES